MHFNHLAFNTLKQMKHVLKTANMVYRLFRKYKPTK